MFNNSNNGRFDNKADIKHDKLKNVIHTYLQDISKDEATKKKEHDYSFRTFFKSTIDSLTSQFLSILTYYFDKYSEAEFHQKMNNRYAIIDGRTKQRVDLVGFDYLGDFKKHHALKFKTFIFMFGKHKNLFNFNEQRIMTSIIMLFQTKGWQISEQELEGIRMTVRRLHNILYNRYDGI